ncbi:microtubule-associated serine/threonine-protein kinase 3-like isoform X2 [Ornithodoros turicata]|uniref:microtubule-associated serine/threonine-protein kinase 3-like isoform X2 n=1 Tax=Ornithodoros turicata TaxID=34597 RepID=UPI00313A3FAA
MATQTPVDAQSVSQAKSAAKVMITTMPRIPQTATVLLTLFVTRESTVSLQRDPLAHYCQEELVLHAQEFLLKLEKQVINYQDVRDMIENLVGLHTMCLKKDPEVARTLGETLRKFIIIIGEVAMTLEKLAEVTPSDWLAIGDAVVGKLERLNPPKPPPFSTFIPKMRDFQNLKMLGAGGFGAVYLAKYRPANFVATVKLVAMDRFAKHKQACMDKVVASVIRNPFLEAYVTIMEYIAGLDLMRVVTKEQYMEIDAVQIIMAQLILALEHMHLRGFLHRDIKVSNMLILPGGRVKVIDFDTTKVCIAHLSRRVLRGYFKRTPYEFNDGESAGTIPYMAPEILKRRPYGRSADWWSSGIVMYKLLTGRVPFRGKTKQTLRERIITAPLKWPRPEDSPHSATTPAKDMTYRMLKKNPVDRLGSRSYMDLKTHSFFSGFDWDALSKKKELCDIPSIHQLMKEDSERDRNACPDPEDKRRHQQIEEMTDVSAESQKRLLCYASPSFKKLMLTVRKSKTRVKVTDSFMETSGEVTSGIDYQGTALGSIADAQSMGPDKLDLTLRRRKSFCRFWDYGFTFQRVKGEDNNFHIYVDNVVKGSPAERAELLPLDVILALNSEPTAPMPPEKVKAVLNGSGPQVTLSVLPSSVYRLMSSRRDLIGIIRSAPKDSVILAACGGKFPYGIGIVDANTYDDSAKKQIKVIIITHAMAPAVNNRPLFPGDIVTQIDGTAVEGMAKEQAMQLLSAGKPQVTLTIIAMSPFRVRRVPLTRLQESGISDASVPSKSTAARISNPPE